MTPEESALWDEVDAFLEMHHQQYKLSFAIEYSSVIDWVVDFTPRRGHPMAREYNKVCCVSGQSREQALRRGLEVAREKFGSGESIAA